jgi:CRISPR/Cas system CSM-associated protein Csm3 (group 7 of RAMP superfamily)
MNVLANQEKKNIFQNRWRITGSLTAISNLHIGSGGSIPAVENRDSASLKQDKAGDAPDAAEVVTDIHEKPYIPASALKGNIRSWLEKKFQGQKELILEIFGETADKNNNGRGGKAEFLDAPLTKYLGNGSHINLWNKTRQTGIETSIVIDRTRGTAREGKLFNLEYVPPGVEFNLEIVGQNMSYTEIAFLLAGLEGFNDGANPITLGGDTRSGKGRMKWACESINLVGRKDKKLRDWLKNGNGGVDGLWRGLEDDEKKSLESEKSGLKPANGGKDITIDIQLKFDFAFMVAQSMVKAKEGGEKKPDFIARTRADGKVILPARSFKGVLRSQVERIIRTLTPVEKWKELACRVDDPKQTCKPYDQNKKDDGGLCIVCQVFGGTGYASRIMVSDFTLVSGKEMENSQEFVAIDRFTGGGAEGAKFNAKPWVSPLMKGTVALRNDKPWALGLLALALRDLIEGDLTFGYGAAKGYGACRVENKDEVIKALNGYQTSLTRLEEKLKDLATAKKD